MLIQFKKSLEDYSKNVNMRELSYKKLETLREFFEQNNIDIKITALANPGITDTLADEEEKSERIDINKRIKNDKKVDQKNNQTKSSKQKQQGRSPGIFGFQSEF